MKINLKSAVAVFVISSILVASTGTAVAETLKKNETVYIKLDNNGKPKTIDVVNWMDVKGKKNIEDITSLDNIKIIPSDIKFAHDKSKISVNLDGYNGNDLFYSGTTNKETPLKVDISYYLDGKKIEAKDLGGKKGEVEIKINLKNITGSQNGLSFNDFVAGKIANYNKTTYTPFMAQVSIDLPFSRFREVEAPNSAMVVVGKNMKLNWIVFPFPDEEINIKLKTDKFELDPISITVLPKMPPVPEVDLEDKLVEMHNGINEMEGKIDLMIDGLDAAYQGSDKLYKGFSQYSQGFEKVMTGSEQLMNNEEGLEAGLNQMMDSVQRLGQAETAQIQMISKITAVNDELTKSIQKLSKIPGFDKAAQELLTGLGQQKTLLEIITNGGKLADGTEFPGIKTTEAGLLQLQEGMSKYTDGQKKYIDGVTALNSGLKQLNGYTNGFSNGAAQLSSGIMKIQTGMKDFKSLGTSKLKSGIGDQVNEVRKGESLKKRLEQRVDEYRSFTGGKNNGLCNVEFLMQTDSINSSIPDSKAIHMEDERKDEEDKGFFSKIAGFFKKLFGNE